jgi:hypothetical protein
MTAKIKLLGVHGLGDHRNSSWKEDWETAITESFPRQDEIELEFRFVSYDDIFENTEISAWQSAKAVGKLLTSGVGGLFSRRRRGLFDTVNHGLRWYAGYVVAWVESEAFQKATRQRVLDTIRREKPDVVLGHSLGSLVTFNALSHNDAKRGTVLPKLLRNLTYVSLGSQIGNPFVVGNLTPGRIQPLDVKQWYHLYNEEDDVFTSPIRLWDADNFRQVETYFDVDGWADHAAVEYLQHYATASGVWTPLAQDATGPKPRAKAAVKKPPAPPKAVREPRRRALLVGINDYPDPASRLDGCVNDVFLMSSVLQECGFDAEQVRVCLNDRATAQGIRDRLAWLLEDPLPNDELVFYYSGHGAQLPTYGDGDLIDRMDETLVPHDFDWSPETCVTDDQIFGLYSQLPYDTRLVMIFDCCHSGGIHRSGMLKARGINPPDDIRHRGLRWNGKHEMWESRDLSSINKEFSSDDETTQQFCGSNGSTYRIGRAMPLRNIKESEYNKLSRRSKRPVGPYLPMILEACQEQEYAYEYRHGVTSYGAFTYSLAGILRSRKTITFEQLVESAILRLTELGYDQQPQILGPGSLVKARVPWKLK